MSLLREQINRQFNTRKVSICEFAESDEFCNKRLYPRQRVLLKLIFLEELNGYEEDVLSEWERGGETIISPEIRKRRDWLLDRGYPHFPEIGLVGGRRSSKGYITGIGMSKVIYDTWMLGDPGTYYGIDPTKEIYFMCVATALQQAKDYQYADLVNTITSCKGIDVSKVLEESFSVMTDSDKGRLLEMEAKGQKVARDFAKIRGKPQAANADSIRGSATMGIVFDEVAFMMEGENRSSADQCYNAAKPALAQFGKDGITFLNSSPANRIGLFYNRYEDSMKIDENGFPVFPTLFYLQFPSWELYKDYEKDPLRRFRNAIMISPDIKNPESLNDADRTLFDQARLEEQANPETFKVERRGQWAEVQDAYLNPEMVDRSFVDKFKDKEIKAQTAGSYVFAPYVAHCDPSSTTAGFGFAIGHLEEFEGEDGTVEPHVVFDYIKRWNPLDYKNRTIDYLAVMEELAHWSDMFRPESLTFDQFNSAAPIQWLRQELNERRINTRIGEEVATQKKNWNRWEIFKTALNLGRVHIPLDCPDSEYAKWELKFLQVKNGRVEKTETAMVKTKDIADCIAEVTRVLLGRYIGYSGDNLNNAPQWGAQGGFRLGGVANFQEFYSQNRRGPAVSPARSMDYRARKRK